MDLQKLRHDHKLSQSDLAELFGCKQSNISTMENSNKPLSLLNVRLLIERFGYDVIAKYAEAGEMPQGATVNIDMHKTSVGNNNNGPVNTGNGNQTVSPDAGLISVMQKQAEHITELLKQQDRLISLLEQKQDR